MSIEQHVSAQQPALARHGLGIGCIVGAIVILSASDAIIKWLSPHYALHQIMLLRAGVALAVTMVFVHLEGGIAILKTRRPLLHLLRAMFIVVANMFFFLGLASMPLADAMAIFFVAPLLITALSRPLLKEHVGPVRWAAVCIGLIGVVIMLRPGTAVFSMTAVLPVIAAMCYACMQMLTRRLGMTSKAATLSFYIQVTFLFVSGLVGLSIGDGRFAGGDNTTLEFLLRAWTWPTQTHALLMALCGVLVAFGGYLMSQAYRVTQAAVVAPFEYVGLPFGVFWGYQVWGDWPDQITFLGAALTIGAGVVVFYREQRQARLERRRARTPGRAHPDTPPPS